MSYQPRLKQDYFKVIVPKMIKDKGYTNVHQVPRLNKIVLNMGVGEAISDSKQIESAFKEIAMISGQHPVYTKSKRSLAGFKLREGMKIGVKVTLRGDRMYEFLDRLVNIVLPRIRDFRGLSKKSFDGKGNYAFGVKEQLIFPEINYDDISSIRGMDIVIVTNAKSNQEALDLLLEMNMPIFLN